MRGRFTLTALFALAGCAPDPELDASVVKDLRILGLAVERPGEVVATGPADARHPLYVFAEDPPPTTLTALVVDPRAPTGPLRVSARMCLAEHDTCDPDAANTVVLATDVPAAPEVVVLPVQLRAAHLNAWLAEEYWHGYDRLFVRAEITVAGLNGARVEAQTVVTFYGPEFVRRADRGVVDERLPLANPTDLRVLQRGATIAEAINVLVDRTFVVPPGEMLLMQLLGNYVFADVSYTLPTGDQKYPRRHLESYAEVVSLYTVRGRVDPPAFVATEPDGFRYTAPERARDQAENLPDTLYIVVHDALGGCAWGRWRILSAP